MKNKYHQKQKERLRKEVCETCQNLFKEVKGKMRKKGPRKISKSEEQKQKLLEYMRNYYLAHKQ